MAKKKQKPVPSLQYEAIRKQISVFISSKQEEFTFRDELRDEINELVIGNTRTFRGILIERKQGNIQHDIDEELAECDIYLMIIGHEYSEITEYEFQTAGKRAFQFWFIFF